MVFSTTNHCRCRKELLEGFENGCFEEEEQDASAEFLY